MRDRLRRGAKGVQGEIGCSELRAVLKRPQDTKQNVSPSSILQEKCSGAPESGARRGRDHWQPVDVVVPIYRRSAGTAFAVLTDNLARASSGLEELPDSTDGCQPFRLPTHADNTAREYIE